MTPLLGAPTWCPARPTRWSPRATRRRALDLDDEVDRAHVDAELEAGRGDQRGEPPGLELLLDLEPLLAGDAAVMGPDQLLAGQLVEPLGQPLRQPPAVGEDDRAAVAADQLEDPRVDRRPDARPHVAAPGRRTARLLLERQDLAERRHVVDRARRPGGRAACARPASTIVTSRPGPIPPRNRAIVSSGRCVADRPIRCIGRASARLRVAQRLEALEAEREVRAALRAGDRVDLVDDDVLDPAQDLARRAGQHQVERFGGRDQDVGRMARDLAAVVGGRVAGAAGDRDVRRRLAETLRREGDPGQRRAQVPFDVVGQGLERRDVQDADRARRLAGRRRARVGREPVERPEERRERLAAAGRGVDERVLAARDRRPAAGLGVGRRLEAGPEPVTDGGREGREGVGDDRARPRGGECSAHGRFRPDVRLQRIQRSYAPVIARFHVARVRRAEGPAQGAAWPLEGGVQSG